MKNIEIKARVGSTKRLSGDLVGLGAKYQGKIHQLDTYYNSQNGRLKIREINDKHAELIFYQRSNKKGSRLSRYQILKIDWKKLDLFKDFFKESLGIVAQVEKERRLWIYHNTRIHLDKVNKLGRFLELETVIGDGESGGYKNEHEKVKRALSLNDRDIQAKSYCDLLLNKLC